MADKFKVKDRVCWRCKKTFQMTAKEIKNHFISNCQKTDETKKKEVK